MSPNLLAQLRKLSRQLGRASRCFTEPEGNGRRRPVRIANRHFAAAHVQDSPGCVAELKHVAGLAFDGKVFVERTDKRPLAFGDNSVVGHFGNRATRRDGGDPGALPGA